MKYLKHKIILTGLIVVCLELFVGIFFLEKRLKMRVGEVYLQRVFEPANIIVDIRESGAEIDPVWKALAQGGEEGGGVRMLEPTVEFVEKIDPHYIRLDHIYDDDYYGVVQSKENGQLKLDWSKLDKTVQDITDSGAKPFFSLSYMPSAVADSKINVPADWRDWQNLVQKTIEHYSKDVPGVYYEVWNEPSLDWFGGWKMYGEKDYRQLYKYAVLGAEQASGVKPFKIGGPAIPVLDNTWIRLLFDFCLSQNLRLDFISWHRYDFSPSVFVNDVNMVDNLIAQTGYQRFAGVEKIITEWGPNSEKDTVYSSNVSASHAVRIIRDLLDRTKWLFAFEIKDGPNQGEEAWGLLTHQLAEGGVKEKPRYYLFDWLSDFKGKRLQIKGEGSQIKGFGVLEKREMMVVLSSYLPQGGKQENFQVTFKGLKDGKYRLFRQKLFQEPQEEVVEIKGGSMVFGVSMDPFEVVRIRLKKVD